MPASVLTHAGERNTHASAHSSLRKGQDPWHTLWYSNIPFVPGILSFVFKVIEPQNFLVLSQPLKN
jgi:hypothetical protein